MRLVVIGLIGLAGCALYFPSSDPPPHNAGGSATTGDKRVFVTSEAFGGALGGLGGADARCESAARAAGLAGTYTAWLSDQDMSAANRMTHSAGAYLLVDGSVFADSWAALVAGELHNPLDTTELGQLYTSSAGCGMGYPAVWTATDAHGQYESDPSWDTTCGNWQDSSSTGLLGDATQLYIADNTTSWTDSACSDQCTAKYALYCFEQ